MLVDNNQLEQHTVYNKTSEYIDMMDYAELQPMAAMQVRQLFNRKPFQSYA